MLKYDIWNVRKAEPSAVSVLQSSGYHCILASVLAARGLDTADKASDFLRTDPGGLHDPFLLKDMDKAVFRLREALEHNEKIAIYGDYDVDGITSVCLVSRYLNSKGANFITHIPDRVEEGYGLNEQALRGLRDKGVSLVITVDSGVTAIELAELAHSIGLSLIITDHHHCRDTLPRAHAVVNPCRPDNEYPFRELAGVGVAFKLISAMEGDQVAQLRRYADLVALGTLADVMEITGENRIIVRAGLNALENTSNFGLQALIRESGVRGGRLSASSIGYVLAPRLNAAGRIGRADLAVDLLMTDDKYKATELARALCEMNQLRQQLENEIIRQALEALEPYASENPPNSIVLSGEGWHQGVIGIVASRLAERYSCPVFLICISDGIGKGSARSVRGIDLVKALDASADILENFGGHEMAAGFSLRAENIAEFTKRISEFCGSVTVPPSRLDIDAAVDPKMLDMRAAEALQALEPFGTGNPAPVFILENAVLSGVTAIGSGKHTRTCLNAGGRKFQAVWFGMDINDLDFAEGDSVDAAFKADINHFRGEDSLQLQLVDIIASSKEREYIESELSVYGLLSSALPLTEAASRRLLPTRAELSAVWRFLNRRAGQTIRLSAERLSRELTKETGHFIALSRVLAGLDIFYELDLIGLEKNNSVLTITPAEIWVKKDLSGSAVYRKIKFHAEGGSGGG